MSIIYIRTHLYKHKNRVLEKQQEIAISQSSKSKKLLPILGQKDKEEASRTYRGYFCIEGHQAGAVDLVYGGEEAMGINLLKSFSTCLLIFCYCSKKKQNPG